jgi:nitrite reductase/ring-hydroxylating ferredoxin subunit
MSDAAPAGFVPPQTDSRLDHVGSYRRTMPVTLDRMFENALDWEHLPHLHAESFTAIDCEAAGDWGWRARVAYPPDGARTARIELRLDREARRWITRTLEGHGAGAEIWTHAQVLDPGQLRVIVDFFVPDVPAAAREKVGRAYAGLYDALYDDDEAMMVTRARALAARPRERGEGTDLGPVVEGSELVEHGGRRWRLVRLDERLVAFEARCPHWLGPLDDAPVRDGIVTCPWHGYAFDLRTGECTTGQACRLRPARPVAIRDGRAVLLGDD